MPTLYPVILSGGTGSRLWPLSRAAYPKQLLPLTGPLTMLQATLERARQLAGPHCDIQPPLLICNQEHRFLVREQCLALGAVPCAIYLEPEGRNTAPAIALAALHVSSIKTDPDALLLVLPADHAIADQNAFNMAVNHASQAALLGKLVTFGITPTRAETGYGYIKAGKPLSAGSVALEVESFVEKPDAATAQRYLDSGEYTWNSGMFLFKPERYLAELQEQQPDIFAAVTAAWQQRAVDLDFIRPETEAFQRCPADSIDYAVMQNTPDAAVIPADIGWSDVGSWDALWALTEKDASGNVCNGDVFIADTRGSYVRAQSRFVCVLGLDDVVVVETPDAVLVMPKSKAQAVKHAITYCADTQRNEHLEHIRVYRPWGWYEAIDKAERFQVKRIMVKPGEKLSLQLHHHRAEHWVVVSGTAKVTINAVESLISENQSAYIPVGHTHRLENPGKVPLHLIEVQSGSYLGEDDIVRLEDTYGRLC
ncbi:MAG: mannose-1-phosphate guanylyltransferase/mannose-6-phosphate isomerase [Pseudomonadales bacterium]|jgi:mannose-1-phosphate guanylyltransferase/mannose-1-phosphate guanylyltransferase/mannose-6-phosphate isomerase|nr:mannose-1-phosphate guanylyltransferase/mannose-6-phosphate isomerase [Pseudomonadales bacterium]